MASSGTVQVPNEIELREILDEQRSVLEKLTERTEWIFLKRGDTFVAERSLKDCKDGSLELRFSVDFTSSKGEDVRKQIYEIMWEGSFVDGREEIEEKTFIYTNPDKNIRVKYLREKFPWPCQRCDYVMAMAREETETSSVVWGTPVDYGVEVPSKVTRGSEIFLCIIENMEGIISKCRMTTFLRFNAGGFIPLFVIKMGVNEMLENMIVRMQNLV